MKIVYRGLAALLTCTASIAYANDGNPDSHCKRIHADLVEVSSTEGCKPEHASCFLGEVDGNHGLSGTTYFKGDSRGEPPSGSPDSVPYSGAFEYHTNEGSLYMRETGVTVPGAVTAHQKIVDATGQYAGATGYLFVSGLREDGIITTQVFGEVCYPDD